MAFDQRKTHFLLLRSRARSQPVLTVGRLSYLDFGINSHAAPQPSPQCPGLAVVSRIDGLDPEVLPIRGINQVMLYLEIREATASYEKSPPMTDIVSIN